MRITWELTSGVSTSGPRVARLWSSATPSPDNDGLGESNQCTMGRRHVEDAANDLLLSAASSWEIAIKYGLGKLPLPDAPERYVPSRMLATGVTALPVEHSHALAVAKLPDHHRDPFDRLLVAQAQLEDVAVITPDQKLRDYPIEVLPADR